jgi:hypothetical protein
MALPLSNQSIALGSFARPGLHGEMATALVVSWLDRPLVFSFKNLI